MLNQLHFREATLDDIPRLLAFEQELISFEKPFNPTFISEPFTYYKLEETILSPDSQLLVGVLDQQIVACGQARTLASEKDYCTYKHYAYLGFMYVIPKLRGQGINQLIIQELLKWSKSKGFSEVQLKVYSENESAIRAYEKVGFKGLMLTMRLDTT